MRTVLRTCAMAIVMLVAITSTSQAQTGQTCPPDCRFNQGASVSLSWQHDPTASADGQRAAATGYRLLIDKVQIGADITIDKLVAGVATIPGFTLPATDGTHTFEVVAINADLGTSATSKPLVFTIGPPPPRVPTNLKITGSLTVALGSDGLWHFTVALTGDQEVVK